MAFYHLCAHLDLCRPAPAQAERSPGNDKESQCITLCDKPAVDFKPFLSLCSQVHQGTGED